MVKIDIITSLLRTLNLHIPSLRGWVSTNFMILIWHKMHTIHIVQQGSKTWMIKCIMFMTSSPMSIIETTPGMSEGDGS